MSRQQRITAVAAQLRAAMVSMGWHNAAVWVEQRRWIIARHDASVSGSVCYLPSQAAAAARVLRACARESEALA